MGTHVRTVKTSTSELLLVSMHFDVVAGHRDAQELVAECFQGCSVDSFTARFRASLKI